MIRHAYKRTVTSVVDSQRSNSAEGRRRLKPLLGAVAAVIVALIAVLIIAEPFASKESSGASVLDLIFQECVKDEESPAECDQTIDGLEGAKSVAVSPDGKSVYVASAWDAALVRFDRDPSSGTLTPQGCIGDTIVKDVACGQETYGLAYPASVAVSSDGRSVYVAGATQNAIVRLNRDTSTGALTPVDCIQDEDEFVTECEGTAEGLSQVEAVAVSPDGKSVYAGSNEDDSIVEFKRETETDVGELTYVSEACIEDSPIEGGDECSRSTNGLDGITAVAVSADNRSVYSTSQFDSAVVRFDRNTTTGVLTPQGCVDDSSEGPDACGASSAGLEEAWSVAVSPDGRSVYAVGRASDAIVRFDRDVGTGALSPKGCIESIGENCAATTSGLYGPQGVVVSPDNSSVYVPSIIGSVVVFDRDSTGALSSVGCVTDPGFEVGGCETTANGLDGATSAAFSPGADSLYVVSQLEETVVHLRRGSAGTLTGRVLDSLANPVAGAPVEVCRAGGRCTSRFSDSAGNYRAGGLADGSYTVTARPPAGLEAEPGSAGPKTVEAGATTVLNVTLGGPVEPPPGGTTITSYETTDGGVPVVYWNEPLTLTTKACPGGSADYGVFVEGEEVRSGAMAEDPSGTYTAQIESLYPSHGIAAVKIEVTCPSGPPVLIDFNIYIDPSGVVRNAATGDPIGGATVTLLRSDSSGGPFEQVPDGSAIMSPGNRSNPDTTASDGSFGWDVIAGYYKVRAEAGGCNSAETGVLTIPPPVTDLKLDLSCPTGEPTTPGETTAPPPPAAPSNSFSLGKVQLNKKKGTATLVVKVPGKGSLALSGKQVKKVSKAAAGAGNVKLAVKPKGGAKDKLARSGSAKVKVRVDYTPTGGVKGSKTKSIKLVKTG
jgi:DNA-binding beta-propeller fold protein YncE